MQNGVILMECGGGLEKLDAGGEGYSELGELGKAGYGNLVRGAAGETAASSSGTVGFVISSRARGWRAPSGSCVGGRHKAQGKMVLAEPADLVSGYVYCVSVGWSGLRTAEGKNACGK
jgi:hypothetical protein